MKKNLKKRVFRWSFFSTFICMCSIGVNASDAGNELTIYLNSENQYEVRHAIVRYEKERQAVLGTDEEQNFPEIAWNLVDKSYLSLDGYWKLVLQELEAGEGPDLIITDDSGYLDFFVLMEDGYLMDISKHINLEGEYLKGVMEAGYLNGERYLVPFCVQMPLLFGNSEVLAEAGLEIKDYDNLNDFLEALLSAQKRLQKTIILERMSWLRQRNVCLQE